MGDAGRLPDGLYESVVTRALLERLATQPDAVAHVGVVDPADQPEVLATHVGRAVLRSLRAHRADDMDARVADVARLLGLLGATEETPVDGVRRLLELTHPGSRPPGAAVVKRRPSTPLSDVALLTNAHGDPALGTELQAELDTCDGVDLICAFVKWHGMRTMADQLRRLRERAVPLRILTTTYLGSTEARALDWLAREAGAQIRIQYDPRRTRLHAKGWLFARASGFDTAYVGSSNLTVSALLDGAEWNVRLSSQATPTLLQKFRATFDTYWHSAEYAPYDPESPDDRDRLARATQAASGTATPTTLLLSGLDVRPYPHQQQILESLDAERQMHDRHRNLVVAATGTGKTVVAALDYRNLARGSAKPPSLLFVAHRREILTQSLRTYREVLGDPTFGELCVGEHLPNRWQHVFASVQSLTRRVAQFPPDAYEVVVIDEFHHAQAPTYRRLLEHLAPRELLGLTATPERGDGTDVRAFFGGRTAAELRVWDAIAADLLSPFHYFGIADGTDLTTVSWQGGRYSDAELNGLYTGNDARARLVLQQLREKLSDLDGMRALGFCAGVAHAEFMAGVSRDAGLRARAVTGQTPGDVRRQAIADLRDRRLQVIFTADLFNEGVDIPEVDTILFLRPTESPTLFLQQLGRGLRLVEGKPVLTVLDFVGHHRAEFRADLRFRALTGASRTDLARDVENGFPFLPSGCRIILDRVVQEQVLRHVRERLAMRWPLLRQELRAHPTDRLADFLDETGLELPQVLRPDKSWTTLRREAGLLPDSASSLEARLVRRPRALAHVDDPLRAQVYDRLLRGARYAALSSVEQRLARMFFFSLWPDGGGYASYQQGYDALAAEPAVAHEFAQVIELSFDAARHLATPVPGRLRATGLSVHARYTREEALAALDRGSLTHKPAHFREGVLATQVVGVPVDAFFVTLKKSEADYSPTTLYRDYPLSPTLFHWESQSTTAADSPTGRRYRDGSSTVLLFVRRERTGDLGTEPYTLLGPATYVSHSGERPMAIIWRLAHPMPADLYADAAVAI